MEKKVLENLPLSRMRRQKCLYLFFSFLSHWNSVLSHWNSIGGWSLNPQNLCPKHQQLFFNLPYRLSFLLFCRKDENVFPQKQARKEALRARGHLLIQYKSIGAIYLHVLLNYPWFWCSKCLLLISWAPGPSTTGFLPFELFHELALGDDTAGRHVIEMRKQRY